MEFVSIPAYVVVCFKLSFKNCKIFPVRRDVLFNRIDMSKKNFFFISWFIRVINLCVKVLGKSNALLKKIRRALNSRKVNALWKKNISIAKCTLFLIRMQLQFDLMFIFFVTVNIIYRHLYERGTDNQTVRQWLYIIEIKYIEKAPLIVLSQKYINFH